MNLSSSGVKWWHVLCQPQVHLVETLQEKENMDFWNCPMEFPRDEAGTKKKGGGNSVRVIDFLGKMFERLSPLLPKKPTPFPHTPTQIKNTDEQTFRYGHLDRGKNSHLERDS